MFAALTAIQGRIADRFSSTDRGATAVEYGLMVGLIAAVIIGAVVILGDQMAALFTQITTTITEETGVTGE